MGGFLCERPRMCIYAAFRELYCRATNPARALMLWDADVRAAQGRFADFRARMMALLQEVRPRPHTMPVLLICAGRMQAELRMPKHSLLIIL